MTIYGPKRIFSSILEAARTGRDSFVLSSSNRVIITPELIAIARSGGTCEVCSGRANGIVELNMAKVASANILVVSIDDSRRWMPFTSKLIIPREFSGADHEDNKTCICRRCLLTAKRGFPPGIRTETRYHLTEALSAMGKIFAIGSEKRNSYNRFLDDLHNRRIKWMPTRYDYMTVVQAEIFFNGLFSEYGIHVPMSALTSKLFPLRTADFKNFLPPDPPRARGAASERALSDEFVEDFSLQSDNSFVEEEAW